MLGICRKISMGQWRGEIDSGTQYPGPHLRPSSSPQRDTASGSNCEDNNNSNNCSDNNNPHPQRLRAVCLAECTNHRVSLLSAAAPKAVNARQFRAPGKIMLWPRGTGEYDGAATLRSVLAIPAFAPFKTHV